jgi:hypothetical protein
LAGGVATGDARTQQPGQRVVRHGLLTAGGGPPERGAGVDQHPPDVGVRHLLPQDRGPVPVHLDQHVLDDVLGVLRVAQQATRGANQRGATGHPLEHPC